MNREELYKEIGYIDDDLIEAANNAWKNNIFYYIAGIAACFCLICSGLVLGLQRDSINFNEIPVPMSSKMVVPSDENTQIVSMTYQDLLAYLGMEQLPDTLGEDLIREKQSFFSRYQDQEGNVLFDTNNIYYHSTKGSKTLSVTFSKVNESSLDFNGEARRSKIAGVPMMLAAFSINADYTIYWAKLEINDVSIMIVADGFIKDEFVNVIKEFVFMLE